MALDLPRIELTLSGVRLRGPVHYRPSTASTNDDIRALALQGAPEGTLVLAETQTAGRGRQGRAWLAQPGQNLLVSLLLRPRLASADYPWLSLLAGLALCDTLQSYGLQARTKWPNDVLVGGRKVAGILLETQAPDFAVLGMGVNVLGQAEHLPEVLHETATTLHEAGLDLDRETLLAQWLALLDVHYDCLLRGEKSSLRASLLAVESTLGQVVTATVRGVPRLGTVTGLGPGGELLLATDQGEVAVTSGEVQLLRLAGKAR